MTTAQRPAAQPSSMPVIEIDRAGKRFDTRRGEIIALEDITLSVNRGEFVSLLGPSGCGKSTLLRLIGGLHEKTSGSVRVGGTEVTAPPDDIGMVFQKAVLLDWKTIVDNVLFPIKMRGLNRELYRERVHELLQLVGLDGFENRYPRELSGGMQQRVALCRALISDPGLLLMDEPFGALDAMTRDEMNLELARIVEQSHSASDKPKTVVFVTHSIPEAVLLSDRIIMLSARPGRITELVDVNLARPRGLHTRTEPTFAELTTRLYEALDVRGASTLRD